MAGKKRKRPAGMESTSFKEDESNEQLKNLNFGKCINIISAHRIHSFAFNCGVAAPSQDNTSSEDNFSSGKKSVQKLQQKQ